MNCPSWRRALSNFAPVSYSIPRSYHGCPLDSRQFPSMKHYFQAAKYTLIGEDAMAREFEIGGKIGDMANMAKQAGRPKCHSDLAAQSHSLEEDSRCCDVDGFGCQVPSRCRISQHLEGHSFARG
eukprot:gnl/TRDRNA2_/TRDRNA2_80058_c0_seq1.p1 gnl/TRDRNA2_/TRDRNA2_80058_c0~~gnl/TRDRNA2_/TRDRNA2_80058_c0_seq1.p1  ORF type:complete len:125 (+),score=10.66 gnl/TRDRNA2_/TRDRNA2_80058_c0_seq1:562-936(+)